MPVDRTLAEDLAWTLVELYLDAQTRLARELARALVEDIDAPDWAGRKLTQLGLMKSFAERLVQLLEQDVTGKVEQTVTLAYARGGKAATEELVKLAGGTVRELGEILLALPGTVALQRLVFALTSKLLGTHLRILRWPLDVYREVVAPLALAPVLMGTTTRLAAAQRAWDAFLARGITGFTDKAGRNWELASYVEMATRTGVAQAAVQGHLDQLTGRGIDLVIVSNAPQECVRCRPWEGEVLTVNGAPGIRTIEREHEIRDHEMVTIQIAGSVTEAIAAGLMHPNCRHSLQAYLPGVTKAPMRTTDPDGDRARQQLRALERKVRKAKLQATAALDPAARKAHERRVAELQHDIRDHIAATDLHRQRHREQIGAAR
ncbi:phage minor capsid protein [Crossiella sp. SN42]|uniref:phage minor capsid protein n=1 Tax=Crossiella sp. SN42 TaxID=2944808 RepID=UPI00207CC219|nr:phage minor capsid protein [Crossiella sp. SN42]MCO1575020.1 phage minor capsid protein [Crossiella sp. SN42]